MWINSLALSKILIQIVYIFSILLCSFDVGNRLYSYEIIMFVGRFKYFQLHICLAGHMSNFMHTVTYIIMVECVLGGLIRIQKKHSFFIQLLPFMETLNLK